MKKVIIVFTKVPKAGVVKTRLTEARGGILTPEEANSFYEACLLDVIDVSLSVDEAETWICYDHDGDRSYLNTLLTQVSSPQKIAGVFPDQGGSFDDCMQFATDFMFKNRENERLVDGVLIIGGDLPTLQPHILKDALLKMEKLSASKAGQQVAEKEIIVQNSLLGACLVEGACQEGGFSIVGLTASTDFNFHEVFYNLQGVTALDMLVNKAEEREIPFAYVEMVPDVDIPVDLASLMPVLRSLEISAKSDSTLKAPKRTIAYLREIGLQSLALPPVRESV